MAKEHRNWLLAAALIAYCIVLLGNVLTRPPWVDEAYVANPAWNLAKSGFMGTTCIEMARSHWTRIDRHTYNTFPLGILNLALWYKVFGFSLAVTRIPSLVWGAVLLGSVYLFVRSLDGRRILASAAVFLLAIDYNFMIATTFGRVDILCAALGFSALAAYVALRPARPTLAVVASCSLAAMSLFTHPNGVMFPAALVAIEVVAFRMTLRWQTALWGILPFAIAAVCWLGYVSQDWKGALDQLQSNSYPGRLTGFLHPLTAIREEITGRYLTAYGLTLGEHPSGPVRARGLVLIAYLTALTAAVSLPEIRRARLTKVLLVLLALFSLYFTFFEGTRFTYYMVLLTPIYTTLLAWMLTYYWQRGRRLVVVSAALSLMVLQVGGVLYRSSQNQYHSDYLPAVAFMKSHASEKDLVFAMSDFGFGYGFERNLKEELTLGYRSAVDPEYIVVDKNVMTIMRSWQTREPLIYAYMVQRVNSYFPIYRSTAYQIYRRSKD